MAVLFVDANEKTRRRPRALREYIYVRECEGVNCKAALPSVHYVTFAQTQPALLERSQLSFYFLDRDGACARGTSCLGKRLIY